MHLSVILLCSSPEAFKTILLSLLTAKKNLNTSLQKKKFCLLTSAVCPILRSIWTKLSASFCHVGFMVCFLPLYYISLASLIWKWKYDLSVHWGWGSLATCWCKSNFQGCSLELTGHGFLDLFFCPGSLECVILQLPPGNLQAKSSGNVFI